jgi:hypothetical protein
MCNRRLRFAIASALALMSHSATGEAIAPETPVVQSAPAIDLPEVTSTDASSPLQPPAISPPASASSFRGNFGHGHGLGLAASIGATRDSYSSAPAMIGDFFGGNFLTQPPGDSNNPNNSIGLNSFVTASGNRTISIAGGDRRFKIAENVSPIPRDRVFFNFNHFENALTDFQGHAVSLDRYTAGIEKTFWQEQASVEFRLPFARGLDSTQTFGSSDPQGTELSNLSLALKTYLWRGDYGAITGGSTLTLPIADDYIEAPLNIEARRIENEAVHLAPFIGWVAFNDRGCFAQGFVQTDFDLNGNDVVSSTNGFLGTIQDQNLLFVDVSAGKWLYRSSSQRQRLRGIAAIAELHYTSTMNDTDSVDLIQNYFGHMDVLNMTMAMNADIALSSIRVGAAAPLRDDEESLYDAEVIVQLTRRF